MKASQSGQASMKRLFWTERIPNEFQGKKAKSNRCHRAVPVLIGMEGESDAKRDVLEGRRGWQRAKSGNIDFGPRRPMAARGTIHCGRVGAWDGCRGLRKLDLACNQTTHLAMRTRASSRCVWSVAIFGPSSRQLLPLGIYEGAGSQVIILLRRVPC